MDAANATMALPEKTDIKTPCESIEKTLHIECTHTLLKSRTGPNSSMRNEKLSNSFMQPDKIPRAHVRKMYAYRLTESQTRRGASQIRTGAPTHYE